MIPYRRASALNRRISQVPLSSSDRSHLLTSLTFAFYSSRPDHFKTKSELKSVWLSAILCGQERFSRIMPKQC